MKHILFLFFIATVMSACSSSPEEKIVGTWRYDRMEEVQKNSPVDQETIALMESVFNGVHYTFRPDGTCEVHSGMSPNGAETGSYRLENDGKTLVSVKSSGEEDRTTLIKLTNDEMWMDIEDGTAVVFVKQ